MPIADPATRARLRGLLSTHAPADDEERGHRDRMLALLERDDCFSRHAFDPGHFTASAYVLSPDGGAVSLILHAKLGRWLQPGGHVELDDPDIEAAARREVAEECGLTDLESVGSGLLDVDVHPIPPGRDPAHEHFDVRFLFRSARLDAVAASDAQAFRWVPLDEVATIDSDRSVMRAIERIKARGPISA